MPPFRPLGDAGDRLFGTK